MTAWRNKKRWRSSEPVTLDDKQADELRHAVPGCTAITDPGRQSSSNAASNNSKSKSSSSSSSNSSSNRSSFSLFSRNRHQQRTSVSVLRKTPPRSATYDEACLDSNPTRFELQILPAHMAHTMVPGPSRPANFSSYQLRNNPTSQSYAGTPFVQAYWEKPGKGNDSKKDPKVNETEVRKGPLQSPSVGAPVIRADSATASTRQFTRPNAPAPGQQPPMQSPDSTASSKPPYHGPAQTAAPPDPSKRPSLYALQTSGVADTMAVSGALPTPPNRPRRISAGTSETDSASDSRESFDSARTRATRATSFGSSTSMTTFDSMLATSPLPASPTMSSWEGMGARTYHPSNVPHAWNRPAPIKTSRRKAAPGELFAALPGEVLELILQELKKLHLAPESRSCQTCWMRDLCSVSLAARKCARHARAVMYEDIQLVGADSQAHRKRYKLPFGPRVTLLRRTLRASPEIGGIVRSLKVPAQPPGVSKADYQALVASVVAACPNLERVVGYYPGYDHSHGRFFQALSSRSQLKEMTWIVEPSPYQQQQQQRVRVSSDSGTTMQYPMKDMVIPGDLQPEQCASFVDFHANWASLATLTIHCTPGATSTPGHLLGSTLRRLPSLQNLYLSHLPPAAFDDGALSSLPALKKLSLAHVYGISSSGLSAFATTKAARSISTLTLQHVNLDSLPALVRILANLTDLVAFNLVQMFPPTLAEDEFGSLWLFPYLASNSVRSLHWDITSHPTCANMADTVLAKSIAAGGFPALRRLRAPNDPEGIFQSLCKPLERVELPADRYKGGATQQLQVLRSQSYTYGGAAPSSPTGFSPITPSPVSPCFSPEPSSLTTATGAGGKCGAGGGSTEQLLLPRANSDLHQSRLAAQARLEGARQCPPRFVAQVVDEDGTVLERFGLGAFIGTAESRIRYVLTPEPGASDEKGGLVGVEDLVADGGEDLLAGAVGRDRNGTGTGGGGREGCSGRWNNWGYGQVADRREKERWWHTERGRWVGVELA